MSLTSQMNGQSEPDQSCLPAHTTDGQIPFQVSSIDQLCYTYYKVFGDLKYGTSPLVGIHGGPGSGHQAISVALAELWPRYHIPVIVYDQIGCGSSTHLPHLAGDQSFWTVDLFLDELNNLVDHFKLRDGFHVLGQSWGGMLAALFAGTQPRGLQQLILASANASKVLSASGVLTHRLDLPPDIQKVLAEKEAAHEFDDPDYKAAQGVFYKKYLYPGTLRPEMMFTLKNMQDDPTVHNTMQGRALVLNEGSLAKATCIPTLHKITAPTLVVNGDTDTSHDISQEPFFELIPRVRWITLPNATHSWLNQPELRPRVLKLLGEFLTPAKMEDRARERNWYGDTPKAMPGRS